MPSQSISDELDIVILDEADLQLRQIHNSQAPISRMLPVEILREIFEYLIFDEPVNADLQQTIILSGVCEYWRSICICMERAWSSIECWGGYSGGVSTDFLKLCLERSGSSPTCICINDSLTSYDRTKEGMPKVTEAEYKRRITEFISAISLVLANLTRCCQLSLEINHRESFDHIFPLRGPMPNLRKLHCEIDIDGDLGDLSNIQRGDVRLAEAQSSWRLDSLVLSPSIFHLLDDLKPASLIKLEVDLESISALYGLIQLINRTTKLRDLRVFTPLSTANGAPLQRPAMFTPYLRKFTIRGLALLSYLRDWNAPLLRHLSLLVNVTGIYPVAEVYFQSLRTLHLGLRYSGFTHTPPEWTGPVQEFLQSHHRLVALSIQASHDLTNQLLLVFNDGSLCPLLQYIHVDMRRFLPHDPTPDNLPSLHSIISCAKQRPSIQFAFFVDAKFEEWLKVELFDVSQNTQISTDYISLSRVQEFGLPEENI